MSLTIKQSVLLAILATFQLTHALPDPTGMLPPSVPLSALLGKSETGHISKSKRRHTDEMETNQASSAWMPTSPVKFSAPADTTPEQDATAEPSAMEKREPKKENKETGYGPPLKPGEGGCAAGSCGGGIAKNGKHKGAGKFKEIVGQHGYYGPYGVKPAPGEGNAKGGAMAKEHPYTGPPGQFKHGK